MTGLQSLAALLANLLMARTRPAGPRPDVALIGSVNDPDVLREGLAWSRQEHAGQRIETYTPANLAGLVNLLASLSGVPQIGFWVHGSASGSIGIAGQVLRIDSKELHDAIGSRALALRSVEFLACDIGNNPPALAAFGKMVGAQEVIGWTQLHALHPIRFERSGDVAGDARAIAKRLAFLDPFVPAGIPRTEEAVAAHLRQLGGRQPMDVTLEYWSRHGSLRRQLADFMSTPLAELADRFTFGFDAAGRRGAPRRVLRDVEATEPLIRIDPSAGPVDPVNPELLRVSVVMTRPGAP